MLKDWEIVHHIPTYICSEYFDIRLVHASTQVKAKTRETFKDKLTELNSIILYVYDY
jgi:hypothetical protein